MDQEIRYVCDEVCKLAEILLPKYKRKKHHRNFFRDEELKQLCNKSAWMEWRDSGRPKSGDLFEKKKATEKDVKDRINELKARMDRLQSELVDEKF